MGRILMRSSTIISLLLIALLAACVPTPTGEVVDNETINDSTSTVPQVPVEETPAEPAPMSTRFTVETTEGDLVQLRPQAIDPDGDALTYQFAAPFDENGNWQTEIGDEGVHDVAVAVNDGKTTTTETVRIIVHRANRAPTIVCREIIVREGEMIDLHDGCTVTDEDGDEVIVSYSGWMSSWRYTTTYEDAGTHVVTLTAGDENHTVTENVTVVVQNTNRPPVFSDDFPAEITAIENDVITLPSGLIVDPDKDSITVTYSEPFNDRGIWRTRIGDAGTYDVDVVASDGENTIKKTVTIRIGLLNTVPTLRTIPDVTVKEGETIRLQISATDREGDSLTTTISGFMTSDTYATTYTDAGDHTVRVAVTDGEFTAEQIVRITVIDVNRPPVFVTPA